MPTTSTSQAMNASDIIKAREGLCTLLHMATRISEDAVDSSRESLAAFERLISEPPQMPMRTYIATQIAGNVAGAWDSQRWPFSNRENCDSVAADALNLADALIERLNRP